MRRRLILTVLILAVLAAVPAYADHQGTHTAANCEKVSVFDNLINTSTIVAGDTVVIPAGACTWTSWTLTKGVTLTGTGNASAGCTSSECTIITDNGSTASEVGLVTISTAASNTYRITNIKWVSGATSRGAARLIRVITNQSSTSVRVDHNYFSSVKTQVFQHNGAGTMLFDNNRGTVRAGNFLSTVAHATYGKDTWPTVNFGDGSWASANSMGTANAVFIESNTLEFDAAGGSSTNVQLIDCLTGGRAVIRYNTFTRMNASSHGTESSGRKRGCRQVEIYGNIFRDNTSNIVFLRSGAYKIFNNDVNSGSEGVSIRNFRSVGSPNVAWGQCNGENGYDSNRGVLFTGTHTGGNSVPYVLTDSGKNFETACNGGTCLGLVIKNTTTGIANMVESVSGNQATLSNDAWAGVAEVIWNTGNTYSVYDTYPCLDQPGWGSGNISSPLTSNPMQPVSWPNQTRDPIYIFNNTGARTMAPTGPAVVRANRDSFYDGTGGVSVGTRVSRPASGTYTYQGHWSTDHGGNWDTAGGGANDGCLDVWNGSTWTDCAYTPYTYPHPLATAGGGDTTPPTVAMSAPANGATVSGASVTVSATASDNVGVTSVQFQLDGVNLGAADTSAPYEITWDTTAGADGAKQLRAIAVDAAGNTTTSTAITVTVSNPEIVSRFNGGGLILRGSGQF